MSQYGSIPPPGAYVPPNQGTPAQGYQQQQQAPFPYQPSTPYGAPAGHQHKAGNTFGGYLNQAVTTGKPMLNKLGKTISSKLGSKPAGTPQHLQSYQNYQEQQGQHGQQGQYGQAQGYQQQQQQQGQFSPQPQQQQWGQPQQQQQQQQNALSPQQSPFHSNYVSPASGHSGQSNYFAPQPNQPPNPQPETPQQQQHNPSFNAAHFEQSGMTMEQYMQSQQGQQAQQGQGQMMPGQQAPFQQEQQLQGQYPGQQIGVIGGTQNTLQPQTMPPQSIQSPHMANVSPVQPVQSQWGPPSAPPQQVGSPMGGPGQPYQPAPSPMQHEQQQHQPPQQQWNNMGPISPQGQGQMQSQMQNQMPPQTVSPPPQQQQQQQQQQQSNMPPHIPLNNPPQPTQPNTPAPQPALPQQSSPTEFIAELPADMGNLSIMESKPAQPTYQAYHAGVGAGAGHANSPSPGFTIPRRSVSSSTMPLADPWRFADPVTELPTREFYILADLLFDALDRKVEPKNTGLLEGPKVVASWVGIGEENKRLYTYRHHTALTSLFSLTSTPHILVPTTPSLTPNFHFTPHSHASDLALPREPDTHHTPYTSYTPALTRAGWYKFFFLQMCAAPEDIGTLLPALCSDTYKPGVLNHPELGKREGAEVPGLKARASEVLGFARERVGQEGWAAMAVDSDGLREQVQASQQQQYQQQQYQQQHQQQQYQQQHQ